MAKCKIGLALGSGAAKGLAHIGVLKAFEAEGVPIGDVSGSSIGAVVGGAYAAGVSVDKIIDFAIRFGNRNRAMWMDPAFMFKGGGLIKGGKIENALRELIGPLDFKDLKMPFFAVATDLVSGKEVVLKEGDLNKAIHASFSVPGIFAPVRIGEHLLVDGGVVAPIPTRVLAEMKCDLVIGVNVAIAPKAESSIFSEGNHGIIDVLLQVMSVAQGKIAYHCMETAEVHIIPDVGEYSWTDFSKAEELIELGYQSTKRHMPIIKGIVASNKAISFIKRLFCS